MVKTKYNEIFLKKNCSRQDTYVMGIRLALHHHEFATNCNQIKLDLDNVIILNLY